jgi:hypothetical protein
LVSNISPSANEKTVTEFFSFCGKITNLKITKYPNKGGEAIVTFETESAAKTAQLLTNALIADRPITVAPYLGENQPQAERSAEEATTTEIQGDQIQNKPETPEDRSHTSVIASLIAAGYVIGKDGIDKARAIDEQNQISQKIMAAANVAKEKITEIDQQLHISETIQNIGNTITTKAHEFDQSYHVSDNVNAAIKTVTQTIESGVAMAKEVPVVQSTTQAVNQVGENIKTMITPTVDAFKANVDDIKQQSNQIIAEKLHEKEEDTPPTQTPPIIPEPAHSEVPVPPQPNVL